MSFTGRSASSPIRFQQTTRKSIASPIKPKRRERLEQKILAAMLPHVVRYLVLRGLVTADMLNNKGLLWAVLMRHLRAASEGFSALISFHDEFAREAFELWDRGKKYPAIVLFATAAEQALNSHYRLAFLSSGLSNEEITTIIRTQTLENKMSWLMHFATKKKFPKQLGKRLRMLFEIRNSIVHYKAVPGHPDRDDDSYSAIERTLRSLGRISLRRDFSLLREFLDMSLVEHDPSFELAEKITNEMLS